MANEEWTTLALIKSPLYLNITATTYDTDLTQLIRDVTARMIDYLDNDDIDVTDQGAVLSRACAVQVSYEWRRRNDPGLSSVTYPDGSVNKFTMDEWLPEVKAMLDRNAEMAA